VLAKVGLSVAMIVEVVVFCMLTDWVKKREKESMRDKAEYNGIPYSWKTSFINCFAAGIFVSMGLVHILPEALSDYSDAKPEGTFAWPAIWTLGGFIFVLLIN
jgi:hypothetical protein